MPVDAPAPHALMHAEVDLRVTERMIEIFHRVQRVSLHERRYMGAWQGTDPRVSISTESNTTAD